MNRLIILTAFILLTIDPREATADSCSQAIQEFNSYAHAPINDQYGALDMADICEPYFIEVQQKFHENVRRKIKAAQKMEAACGDNHENVDGTPSIPSSTRMAEHQQSLKFYADYRAEKCPHAERSTKGAPASKRKPDAPDVTISIPRVTGKGASSDKSSKAQNSASPPKMISLKGYNGKTYVEGTLKRVGKSSWKKGTPERQESHEVQDCELLQGPARSVRWVPRPLPACRPQQEQDNVEVRKEGKVEQAL